MALQWINRSDPDMVFAAIYIIKIDEIESATMAPMGTS